VWRYLFVAGSVLTGYWLGKRTRRRGDRGRYSMRDGQGDRIPDRRRWEGRFPALDDEWNLWWIEGDGALLGVVPGSSLSEAVDIVARHHERCSSITVSVAKRDSFGEVVRDSKRGWVITGKDNVRPTN